MTSLGKSSPPKLMVQPAKVNSADKFKEIGSAQTSLVFKLFF